MNVAYALERQARERPRAIAIVDRSDAGERRITFGELDAAARDTAARIRRHHRPGEVIAVFIPMSIELYVAVAGILYAGCTLAICDPQAGWSNVCAALRRMRPRGVIATPLGGAYAATIPALLAARHYAAAVSRARSTHAIAARDDDDIAVLSLTSGSTSTPKIVVRSHATLRAQLDRLLETTPLAGPSVATMPIVMLANLASGITSVIPALNLRHLDARAIARLGTDVECTGAASLVASPALLEAMTSSANLDSFRTLRHIVTGGAPVMPSLATRVRDRLPHARMTSVYGSTEAEPIACIDARDVDASDLQAMREGKGLLAGFPVNGCGVKLVDEKGGAGEIAVTGPHVVRGYLDGIGDRDTKIHEGGRIWHRTGDLGRIDERGRLWLLGRTKAAREGFYPLAIECALSFDETIARCAAIELAGRRILAVEIHGSAELAPAVASHAIDDIVLLKRIPVDTRHFAKVDYPALERALRSRATLRRPESSSRLAATARAILDRSPLARRRR